MNIDNYNNLSGDQQKFLNQIATHEMFAQFTTIEAHNATQMTVDCDVDPYQENSFLQWCLSIAFELDGEIVLPTATNGSGWVQFIFDLN